MTTTTVIVPVFNAFEALQECLRSLAQETPENVAVLLLDDASTDARVWPFLLQQADGRPGWQTVSRDTNGGFVETVNNGMQLTEGDVILLNSDTVVTSGWWEKMTRCLQSDSSIATATPWTNNGEIVSLPQFCQPNPVPTDLNAVAACIADAGVPAYPELPTAVGFCMAISRAALEEVGLFDAKTFGRGYGEENDFCRRAAAAGMRNVLCDDAYVAHLGGASFGPLGISADQRAMDRLLALHPDYLDVVRAFINDDPLSKRRQQVVDAIRSAGIALG